MFAQLIRKFGQRFQWLKKVKRNYLAKSPLRKWHFLRTFHYKMLKLMGAEFMDPNYKANFRTILPIFLISSYTSLLIFTIFHYRNEPFKAILPTPALGFYVPATTLLVIVIVPSFCKNGRYGYDFAAKYIYANSDISPKNYEVCDRMAMNLLLSSVRITLLTYFSLILCAGAPVYKTFFTDEYDLVIPVVIPFVNPDTTTGFIITMGYQALNAIGSIIIVPGIEHVSSVIKNNISVIAAVIDNGITELQDQLNEHKQFSSKQNVQFRNLIAQVVDFDSYVENFNQLLYWKFFLTPVFGLYSIIVGMLLFILDIFASGLGAAACLYIQLLILCDMGQNVNNAYAQILDALNQFPIDLLPKKKQEMFALLLNRVQNGSKFTMGPLAELNYQSATKFTKMIYTYLMAMLKAIK